MNIDISIATAHAPNISSFRNNSLTSNSRIAYTNAVKSYYQFIHEKSLIEGMHSVTHWLNTYASPNTYNLKFQAIKEHLLKRFEFESPDKRLVLHEALNTINRKKPKIAVTETEYLTFKQVIDLSKLLTDNISCIFLAMFWTGCRVSELIQIKLTDCKTNGSTSIRITNGKGGKEREVYMPCDLHERILRTFEGKLYLFETREGNPYHRVNITNEIKRQSKAKMGLCISSHTLRHSKAMYLKDVMKLTPDQIAKALGHSSVLTTLQHYFHGTPSAQNQGIV